MGYSASKVILDEECFEKFKNRKVELEISKKGKGNYYNTYPNFELRRITEFPKGYDDRISIINTPHNLLNFTIKCNNLEVIRDKTIIGTLTDFSIISQEKGACEYAWKCNTTIFYTIMLVIDQKRYEINIETDPFTN